MDLASSTVGHMCPSPAHRRSCTTQSDPVKPGPDFQEDNTIMAMSPQRMPQSCQPLTDQSSRSLVPYRSSQQQSDSHTSSEPLAYLGSPLPSQLVARQQAWAASPVSGWAGEAPDHAFVDTGTPRGLPWNNFDQAGVQTWVSPQHYQPAVSRGNTTYQQRLYRPTAEQNHYYSQREPCITTDNAPYYSYHSMSPTVTHAAEYPIEGYAGTSGPAAQGLAPYRRSHIDLPSSPPTGVRSLALMPDHSQSSSRQASQDEAHHMQSPTTPSSDFSDGRGAAHYAETVPESLSPSASEDKRAHGVPACSNKSAETPYAQLIYQAFMSSPRRALKLQEIYQWFLENTDKGQPGQGKGWQNSIRHNLSMNGVGISSVSLLTCHHANHTYNSRHSNADQSKARPMMAARKTARRLLEHPSRQLNGSSRSGPSVKESRARRATGMLLDATRTRSCAARTGRTRRLGDRRGDGHHRALSCMPTPYRHSRGTIFATTSLTVTTGSMRLSLTPRQSNWNGCRLLR